jgi:hypothetical protein
MPSGGDASIRLLNVAAAIMFLGRRTSSLALKVVVQNDRDFVVLIVL